MRAKGLRPDVSAALAFEAADPEVDPDLGEAGVEQVFAVLGRAQPGAEDRADGAVAAGAPGEVLADVPALGRHVAVGSDPVAEFAPAGEVAEAVAGDDVLRL